MLLRSMGSAGRASLRIDRTRGSSLSADCTWLPSLASSEHKCNPTMGKASNNNVKKPLRKGSSGARAAAAESGPFTPANAVW
jgi:hypothetical protein